MPAFEARTGMPYWVDLSTSEVRKSTYFYTKVLGWEIDDAAYRTARVQGLPVAGFLPQPAEATMPDTWVTYFLSGDIDGDTARVAELGGRVLSEPIEVSMGAMSLCVDNAGGLFGLIQPAGEDSFVAAGEPGTPVWHDYTATTGFEEVGDFYRKLFNWETVTRDGYSLVVEEGGAFAGMRDATGQFPPSVPGFWQSFLGVLNIDEAAKRVVEFGGEVIRGPEDSEFGRLLLISDSTGATVTLCEVEEPVDEAELSESESILNL
ncbi:VOC family protein [Corynebacterium breve]|uniref:VOC family protein n=1 Tax=Corynebacterium breve TaxID=3049799 RepID=A0ABY8VDV3_9CORY|nr:VOC family protein [Corynebacterium breve]WIM67856.1 VOC family protein [Corynebacterium breve]